MFASGLSVMGVEILAGRILAPEFGSTIYTWGSIIGVFMAALSVGYYVGGKAAAERASLTSLQRSCFLAALYLACLVFFAEQLLSLSTVPFMNVRYAPLLPVTLLFGPPVFVLGFISPYAAEIKEQRSTGEASGTVFAIGTVGSIGGAFLTTFFLVPVMSVDTIKLLYVGVLLVAGVLVRPRFSTQAVVSVVLVLGVVAVSFIIPDTAMQDVVYQTQTPYQELSVQDQDGVRTMYLDGHPQSAMFINGSDGDVFTYTKYFDLPFLFSDNIERVLFIGGGGFTGPKRFARSYDLDVDVVEIDPVVVDVAREYFGVDDAFDIFVEDGRAYLRESNVTYDVIVVDAYRKASVPFHVTTEEFLQLASSRLDEDGIVYANLISTRSGAGARFYHAQYKTMQRVFPNVYSFPTLNTSRIQNVELVATKEQSRFTRSELRRRAARYDRRNLTSAVDLYVSSVLTGDAPVLTDEHAPVEVLLEPLLGRSYAIGETI